MKKFAFLKYFFEKSETFLVFMCYIHKFDVNLGKTMKKLYILTCLFWLFAIKLFAVDSLDISKLPKLLGTSNVGKEFYFTFIPTWEIGHVVDLKIYISSDVATNVTVEVTDKGYKKTKKTIPNDIIEFTLSPAIGQCYRKTSFDIPKHDQIWRDAGVHVYSDNPIICYGVTRGDYNSDSFLALPVNVLGTEYIVASFADPSPNTIQWLPSYTGITAAYDKTKVTFTMGGTEWSKTAGGLQSGEITHWNLNMGDVLLIASLGSHAELTGSTISASKPVSVVSGNYCAYIPTNCGCCDFIMEMELPTQAWGTEYHVTNIANRTKNSIIKVFAKEAKTKIFRDYQQIGFISYAGGVEGMGYLHFRADEGKVRPVVISGDKPINVTQFNCGQQDDNIVSDPFQMVLVPTEQYQKEMTFNTPGIRGGYGFPQNYINLCYEATDYGTIPDDIYFAQFVGKAFEWTQLKDLSPHPGSPFTKPEGKKNYYFKTLLLPGDGVYKIKADKPFQAYAYGFSSYDSYGHPASVLAKRLDIVDTVAPNPVWKMDCTGNVNVDTTYIKDLPEDEDKRSNISMIIMHSDVSYNYKLVTNFIPCIDSIAFWRLDIIDNSQDARAVVTFSDCAGNDTTIVIEYDAVKLEISPKATDFGLKNNNETVEKTFFIVNKSDKNPAQMKSLKLKQNNQGFSLYDSTGLIQIPNEFSVPVVLNPLDTFRFVVKFTNSVEGEYLDSIGVGDTCKTKFCAKVSALVGSPIIDVSGWAFPPTMVGCRAYGQFDIENDGNVTLTITDYKGPFLKAKIGGEKIFASDQFEEYHITAETPLRLKPREVRTFEISFTPDDKGEYKDSIVFYSNTSKDTKVNQNREIDSVAEFSGTGIKSEFKISSYNWERKRIDRPGTFPAGPYPAVRNAKNADTAIKISNNGTQAVTIRNINNYYTLGDISAFEFDRSSLINRTINPGETVIVPVKFHPTLPGNYFLGIAFETDSPLTTETTSLTGIGILPRIETRDVDFGKTAIADYINASVKLVTFRNLNNLEWQYGDSVTISDFMEVNINPEIFNSWTSYPEPFRYDKGDMTKFKFPIVIQQGDSITFNAEFVAKSYGMFTGSLTTISDAENEVTSNWTGYDSSYVDVEEIENHAGFNIYPNPAGTYIEISGIVFNQQVNPLVDVETNIQIYNIYGEKMPVAAGSKPAPTDNIRIDISDFPNGIYFIRLANEIERFVILR